MIAFSDTKILILVLQTFIICDMTDGQTEWASEWRENKEFRQ